jgi:cytochrome c oxidase subunit 2
MRFNRILASVTASVFGVLALLSGVSSPAHAQTAKPWQLSYQDAATPVAERVHSFHDILLVLITAISVFVLALLIYVMVRFNAKANPTPSRTTHNTLIEVLWTVVPIMILVGIAVPSFKLLYFEDRIAKPDMTLKVTGHQWYWSYAYPDQGNIAFDSLMVPDDQIKPGQFRLLETDNRIVVPVDANVRVLVTADDVLHSWAVPAFGVKLDAVPGRLNETWFRATRTGTYYGQCSELCGVNHGFMPIAVEVVSKEAFANWAASKKKAAALTAPAAQTAGTTANVELARRADASARGN